MEDMKSVIENSKEKADGAWPVAISQQQKICSSDRQTNMSQAKTTKEARLLNFLVGPYNQFLLFCAPAPKRRLLMFFCVINKSWELWYDTYHARDIYYVSLHTYELLHR